MSVKNHIATQAILIFYGSVEYYLKNDNRRQLVIQHHYLTYQRKGNHELQIQALNTIVAGSQNQINN